MHSLRAFVLAAAAASSLTLSACAPGLVIGGAAAVGVAAYEERGVEGVARDVRTASLIQEKLFEFDHSLVASISVEVFEGRVLMTGQVETEQERADAVRLAWQVEGVTDVLNEIHVTTEGGILNTARDAWITTQLKSKLTFDENIYAINYSVETVGGTVYLIGVAQSQEELDRVMAHGREISYVKHIVSHVRIKAQTAGAGTNG